MTEPSTEWREVVPAGEAERHEAQAKEFAEMQGRKDGKFGTGGLCTASTRGAAGDGGGAGRSAGVRQAGDLLDGEQVRRLDPALERRLQPRPDHVPDIRGFSFKVLAVGRAALGGEAVSQDFALINHERFSSATSEDFTKVVTTGGSTPGKIALRLLKDPGMIPQLKTVSGALKEPFSGFATQDFFTAAPIAYGPYAVRVKLAAASSEVNAAASQDWAADIYGRLENGPLNYDLQVQFFSDEEHTPIEDASINWQAPYLTVARLAIPRQLPDPTFGEEVEAARFDPWNAVVEHRPLGEVMRARKVAYFASQQHRSAQ